MSDDSPTINTPSPTETRTVRLIFPSDTNHHGNLFGGVALAWMDQAAYMGAARWCRSESVTAHIDAIDFKRPVRAGTIVELIARLVKTGRTSMHIDVETWAEPLHSAERFLVCRGLFVMVAVDEAGKPVAIPPLA
jgi:acyl-CoA hydrolase